MVQKNAGKTNNVTINLYSFIYVLRVFFSGFQQDEKVEKYQSPRTRPPVRWHSEQKAANQSVLPNINKKARALYPFIEPSSTSPLSHKNGDIKMLTFRTQFSPKHDCFSIILNLNKTPRK